jgi:hypothetical protein
MISQLRLVDQHRRQIGRGMDRDVDALAQGAGQQSRRVADQLVDTDELRLQRLAA